MSDNTNDQLVLVVGYSSTGKSASLRNIPNKSKWMYLNTESGKRLPFRGSKEFQSYIITDPHQVIEAFTHATNNDDVDGIIIDSLTFLMEQYESQYVIPAADGRKAWVQYQQYFKTLMQQMVPAFNKPVIIIAHVKDDVDETTLETKTSVPIKGALKGTGIEAYFSCIVAAKRMSTKDLKGFESKLLNITTEEENQKFKYVFQTRLTSKTTGERIRSPMELFTTEETYMDNDISILLDHLKEYYN